jgi:hypothetical protein
MSNLNVVKPSGPSQTTTFWRQRLAELLRCVITRCDDFPKAQHRSRNARVGSRVTATIAAALAVGGNTVPPSGPHCPPALPPLQVGLLGTVKGVVDCAVANTACQEGDTCCTRRASERWGRWCTWKQDGRQSRSGKTRLDTLSQPLRRRRDEYRYTVAAVWWLPLGDDQFAASRPPLRSR